MRTFSGQIIEICMHLLCDNIVRLKFFHNVQGPPTKKVSRKLLSISLLTDFQFFHIL